MRIEVRVLMFANVFIAMIIYMALPFLPRWVTPERVPDCAPVMPPDVVWRQQGGPRYWNLEPEDGMPWAPKMYWLLTMPRCDDIYFTIPQDIEEMRAAVARRKAALTQKR